MDSPLTVYDRGVSPPVAAENVRLKKVPTVAD